jgi:hypothetical protein
MAVTHTVTAALEPLRPASLAALGLTLSAAAAQAPAAAAAPMDW